MTSIDYLTPAPLDPLPYDFDLCYDLKYYKDIVAVCEGRSSSDATPENLRDLFNDCYLPIPHVVTKTIGEKYTNPCASVPLPEMCTMGVGGTRLHISGTREEVEMVKKALEEFDLKQPRRSARL